MVSITCHNVFEGKYQLRVLQIAFSFYFYIFLQLSWYLKKSVNKCLLPKVSLVHTWTTLQFCLPRDSFWKDQGNAERIELLAGNSGHLSYNACCAICRILFFFIWVPVLISAATQFSLFTKCPQYC